jgi:4'-phosphopantetheinyl transferase
MSLAPDGGVDVWWQVSGPGDGDDASDVVSREERQRAEGMAPDVADRFLRSRALQRRVLSLYLGRDPRELVFSSRCRRCGHPTHGKPRLVGGGVEFNLSRTRGAAVMAVSRDPVGVDVESAAAAPPLDAVARVAIGCDRRARLEDLPPEGRRSEILAAWTYKEAYLKGIGAGLAIGPQEVECPLPTIRRWRPVHCRHQDAAAGWWVRPIGDEPGFVAALAVTPQPTNVRVLRFESIQSLNGAAVGDAVLSAGRSSGAGLTA